jgi:3-oxoacyl-[acyl-carrier-protein] synthase-1
VRAPLLVTGMGAVSALGLSVPALWEAVRAGRSGIGPIRQWDAEGWPCRLAGEIPDFDPRALVSDRKLHKLLSRADLLGLCAAREALTHSRLLSYREGLSEEERSTFNERSAVVTASGGENYRNQYDFFPLLSRSGGDLAVFGAELTSTVNPMWLLRTLPNNVLCYAGVTTGLKGPNANFTSHSASGALAILEAARMLEDGEADRALVIGYDSPVEPQAILYFAGLGLLSSSAIRSFDRERDGSLLGEGAAALVLETAEAARRRGAEPKGELLGGAVVNEAEGLLSLNPEGEGVARAMRQALAAAGLEPRQVSLVAAHANGTLRSDASEGRAILELFGAEAVPVTGFKWAVGHLIAASGVLESVLTLLSLGEGEAPAIATLNRLDPSLTGLLAAREPLRLQGRTGLLIGRGFGGQTASIVLGGAAGGGQRG